ncbi:MAG: FAD binding domain-containing protein, partial [Salinibacterium sp.]|nr:FAD binding domain-containing protein [Salinibacterium sp.]
MDLITVREVRMPRSRDELVFAPGDRALGGGTWLYSEPQEGLESLVDLTSMGWTDVERTGAGLVLAATCSVATLRELSDVPLFQQCADSLLASWKTHQFATIGGNVALALPAGSMTSLCVALDAVAVIWTATSERRMPVAELVLGVQSTALKADEVIRAIEFPASALAARTGFRRIARSPLGRTGTLVTGRVDSSGEAVFTVSGGTTRPHQLRFDEVPSGRALASAVKSKHNRYHDAHASPHWRRAL